MAYGHITYKHLCCSVVDLQLKFASIATYFAVKVVSYNKEDICNEIFCKVVDASHYITIIMITPVFRFNCYEISIKSLD